MDYVLLLCGVLIPFFLLVAYVLHPFFSSLRDPLTRRDFAVTLLKENDEAVRGGSSSSSSKQKPKPKPKSISLVIPAYNEEERLPVMLRDAEAYLSKLRRVLGLDFRIIIVNDGSKDGTAAVAVEFARRTTLPSVTLVDLVSNCCN